MRTRARAAPVILALLVLVGAAAYVLVLPPGPHLLTLPPDLADSAPFVRGAFHVHTDRSDGGGSIGSVAAAARDAGLQFVIFTDHGDGTRMPDPPTYRAGVLCLDAVEISARGGHYIAVGLRGAAPYPLGGDASGVVEDVRRLGGFGVAAHPTSPKPALAWTDPALDIDGFEWLNGDSQWRDDSWLALSRATVSYVVRPAAALASLLDRPDDALSWWDVAPGRRLVGLAGADAHARLALGRSGEEGEGYDEALEIAFPDYEQVFRTFSTRVELDQPWTGEPAVDAAALLRGIRRGRTFTVVDALASPGGLRFTGTVDGRTVPMGTRVQDASTPIEFRVSTAEGLPADARLLLFRNGQVVAQSHERRLTFLGSEPGTYRVEVSLPRAAGGGSFPWIVSNPIYVGRDQTDRSALASSIVSRERRLTQQTERSAWMTEHDISSTADIDVVGEAVTLRYGLGGSGSSDSVYVAAVYPVTPGDLAPFDRLTLEAGADRPHRVSVQVRAGGRRGQPRWQRSRYLGPTVETVVVPFADLAAVDAEREPLNLGDIDAILIVIDLTNSRPQTDGTLTLRNARLEATD